MSSTGGYKVGLGDAPRLYNQVPAESKTSIVESFLGGIARIFTYVFGGIGSILSAIFINKSYQGPAKSEKKMNEHQINVIENSGQDEKKIRSLTIHFAQDETKDFESKLNKIHRELGLKGRNQFLEKLIKIMENEKIVEIKNDESDNVLIVRALVKLVNEN